jgi:hypothetical protein
MGSEEGAEPSQTTAKKPGILLLYSSFIQDTESGTS